MARRSWAEVEIESLCGMLSYNCHYHQAHEYSDIGITPIKPVFAADGGGTRCAAKARQETRIVWRICCPRSSSTDPPGLLHEGTKLPTESELVRSYDVSRTVVREALSKYTGCRVGRNPPWHSTFVLPARQSASPMLSARASSASPSMCWLRWSCASVWRPRLPVWLPSAAAKPICRS